LVLFDRLTPAEQLGLEALSRDPDCYGVLRPRNTLLSMKAVTRDTALLLLTLRSPSLLPRYAIAALEDRCDSVIGQMVLDGILEIEANGEMLSGPAAQKLVSGEAKSAETGGSLAALSQRALEYAETLEVADQAALSSRLYMYNRVPASSRWYRLLADEEAAQLHVGIRAGGAARMLDAGWIRVLPQSGGGWMAWQSRRPNYNRSRSAIYKLYVSPACTELRAAFQATVEAVSESSAIYWKAGNDVYGLLRPDKIVVYFDELADLLATAAHLQEKLRHCPAQGVPFTSEIAEGGLLSWGIDPPAEEHSVPWLARESWRGRICNRLAAALTLAKSSPHPGISPSRFAVERLRLEGIDTDTWAPTVALTWGVQART
jgi:hypothetical protein